MRPRPLLFFFLLLLVPFTVCFLRPDFIGVDSYAHLLLTCKNNNVSGITGTSFSLFSVLPCNFMALKLLLFGCAAVSGFFIIQTCRLFSPKNYWLASILIFLSSTTVLEFTKLENDTFAIPFLFASIYFFYRGIKTGSRKSWAACFGLLAPAAMLWTGAGFFLLAYALTVYLLWVFIIPVMLTVGNFGVDSFLGQVIRTNRVAEDLPFKFHVHFLLNIGVAGCILEPILLPQAAFFFMLGIASAKFWILSLPLLVVGLVRILEEVKIPALTTFFLIASLVTVGALAQSVWLNPPTQDDWQAIDFALAVDGNANSDWGKGYWMRWKGGTTDSFGSVHRQTPFLDGQVVVTQRDTNCTVLKEFGTRKVVRC